MTSFIGIWTVLPRICPGRRHLSHHNERVYHRKAPRRLRECPALSTRMIDSAPSPSFLSSQLENASRCIVEDHIESGMNIVIGGIDEKLANAISSFILTQITLGKLMDMCVRGSTDITENAIRAYELPNDLTVNYKGDAVDVFIIAATQVDSELNAVFESTDMDIQKHAASNAKKCIVITNEGVRQKYSKGLTHFTVQCDSFMPKQTVKEIRDNDALGGMIQSVQLRSDSSHIADLTLEGGYRAGILDSILRDVSGVRAIGLLPQNPQTVVVVMDNDSVYDVTGTMAHIKSLSESDDLKKLVGDDRKNQVANLKQWKDGVDGRDTLQREFRFSNYMQARAFVREVERLAIISQNFPEVYHVYNRVTVILHTIRTSGVSPLDIAIARELGATCDRLQGCYI